MKFNSKEYNSLMKSESLSQTTLLYILGMLSYVNIKKLDDFVSMF